MHLIRYMKIKNHQTPPLAGGRDAVTQRGLRAANPKSKI